MCSVAALSACGGSGHKASVPASTAPTGVYQTLVDAGIHLLGQGNTNAATQLFEQAIAQNPHDPLAYYNLGVVYQQAGNTAHALQAYGKALAANPTYVSALYNEAVIYGATDPSKAMSLYRKVIAIQPVSPTAYLNLGLLESASSSSKAQGLVDLAKAVQLDPSLRANIPTAVRSQIH